MEYVACIGAGRALPVGRTTEFVQVVSQRFWQVRRVVRNVAFEKFALVANRLSIDKRATNEGLNLLAGGRNGNAHVDCGRSRRHGQRAGLWRDYCGVRRDGGNEVAPAAANPL